MTQPQPQPDYDPIFNGLINYFKEMEWQRIEDDISIHEIIEILTDFAKMEKEESATHTPAAPAERLCDECNIIEMEERLMNLEQELKDAYRNGFDEGFGIGKSQCETHHQEMKEQASKHERERVLKELSMWRIKRMNGMLKKDVWQGWNDETDFIESLRGGAP